MATVFTPEELDQLEAQQQPKSFTPEQLDQLEASYKKSKEPEVQTVAPTQPEPVAQAPAAQAPAAQAPAQPEMVAQAPAAQAPAQPETVAQAPVPEAKQTSFTPDEIDKLAAKQEFAPVQEAGKGFKSAVEGIKMLPTALGLQASSEMIPFRTKELELFDRIDKGEEISPAEVSRARLDYATIRNYQNANPEKRNQYRAFNTEQIQKHQGSVTEALELYKQFQKDVAPYEARTDKFSGISTDNFAQTTKDFANWLGYNFGSGAAQLAPIMLSAITMGPTGVVMTGSAMAMQEAVGNRLEYIQKEVKNLPPEQQADIIAEYLEKTGGISAAVALASGTLDRIGGPVGQILKQRFAKEMGQEAVKYATKTEAFKAGAKEIPKSMGQEFLTGSAQEAAQITGKRAAGEQTGDILTKENALALLDAGMAEGAGSTAGSAVNVATQVGRQAVQQRGKEAAEQNIVSEAASNLNLSPEEQEAFNTKFDAAITNFQNQGVPEKEAFRLAGELMLRREGNVEPAPTKPVTGRIEPSFFVPEQGAAAPEGVAPPDTTGLARPVEDTEPSVAGEGTEPAALGEIPTLTERAPATTYAQLQPDDKAGVLQEAQGMWESGEANLPMAKAWNSLPSWKRDMFAQEVYANYDEMTSNGEVFRAAMDKVIEAKKPEPVKAPEVEAPAAEVPVETPKTEAEQLQALIAYDENRLKTLPKTTVNAGERFTLEASIKDAKEKLAAETPAAAPVEQAQLKLAEAETAVAEAVTPEAKKEATQQRNVARQEVKQAQAAEPAAETPAAKTPAAVEETVPTDQEMKDAGFSSYEIDQLKRKPWPERYRQIKAGYRYIGGQFRQVTQADVDIVKESNQRKQILKAEAKAEMDKAFAEDPNAPVSHIVGSDWNSSNWSTQTPEQYQNAAYAALDRKYGFPDSGVAMLESRLAAANKANGVKETPATTTKAPKKRGRGRPAKPKVEGAEPAAPKPRGRKPNPPLPPEVKVVADKARRKTQKDAIYAGRDVDNLIGFLSNEFDPTDHESPEFTKVGIQGLENVRREYIYKLNQYATTHRTKPTSGGKAKDFLANSDQITLKERADLAERLKFEAKRKPSAAHMKSAGTPVQAFYNFKNATQAISHIMRNGTPFEKALAARLKPFVADVKLIIADADTHPTIAEMIEDPEYDISASGVYYSAYFKEKNKYERMIVLRGENFGDDPSQQGVNNVIFLHEALHAATEAKIDQWQDLTNAGKPVPPELQKVINELINTMAMAQVQYETLEASGEPVSDNLRHKFDQLDITNDLKEFVAYGMTDPEIQQFLLDTPGGMQEQEVKANKKKTFWANLFNRFIDNLRNMFNMDSTHRSSFQDLMLVTEGLLQEQEFEPTYSANAVLNALNKKQTTEMRLRNNLAASRSSTENNASLGKLYAETRNVADALRLLKATYRAMDVSKVRLVLPTLTTEDITRWAGDKIKNLARINDAVQSMAGMRNNMLRGLAEKIPAWVEFNKKYEVGGRLLADVMHASTLKSVDPTAHANLNAALQNDPYMQDLTAKIAAASKNSQELRALRREQTVREKMLTEVYDMWGRLGKFGNREGQRLFIMAKKAYADTFDLHEKLLTDKINASKTPAPQKQQLLASITKTFQEAKRMGVYFPLMRYGNHWFSVGKGASGEFYMFESATARNNFVDKRVAELQAAGDKRTKNVMIEDMDIDMGDDVKGLRNKTAESSQMLKDIFEMLEKGGIKDIESVKDQVYQMYLMTLPDKDMRKKYVHRQGKAGFSADVIRNFVTSQHTAANQLARLAYADDIRSGIGSAYAELARNPDKLKLSAFVDEVALRAGSEITPPSIEGIDFNKYASLGNSFVFYYMLTSPKSALAQMTQLPIVTLPALIADYGSSVPRVVARYSNLFRMMGLTKKDSQGNVTTEWGQPSINDSMYIRNIKDPVYKAALTKAWNTANDRDIFMSTYAADMSGRADVPTSEYHGALRRSTRGVLNFISGAFHHAERITREIAYMSTFELEYAKSRKEGKTTDEATESGIEKATKITYDSLFNYSNYNKPRILKHPLTKIPYQFMSFPLQMTSYLVRNFFATIPYYNKEGKRDAAIKFFGTLGMTTLFAGVTGLPMYSAILGMAEGVREMLRGEDDEDYDEDDDGNPLGKRNLDLWFREWFLPTYFGDASALARALNLTPEQAALLTRSIKMGPISALTDLNIGSSTSLDGLFFRSSNPSKDSKGALMQTAYDFTFGAFGSMGTKFAEAFDDFNNGNFNRAVEGFLPAFARGTATSVRLSEEGAKTRQGYEVMNSEFYTTGKLFAQMLGFASTEVADLQKANYLAKQLDVKINTEKTRMLKMLDIALQKYDNSPTDTNEDYVDKVLDKITKYNNKNGYGGFAITGETIANSIKARQKRAGSAYQGLSVSPKNQQFIYPLVEKGRSEAYK